MAALSAKHVAAQSRTEAAGGSYPVEASSFESSPLGDSRELAELQALVGGVQAQLGALRGEVRGRTLSEEACEGTCVGHCTVDVGSTPGWSLH